MKPLSPFPIGKNKELPLQEKEMVFPYFRYKETNIDSLNPSRFFKEIQYTLYSFTLSHLSLFLNSLKIISLLYTLGVRL